MRTLFLLFFLAISSFSFSQNEYVLAENYYRDGAYEKATQIYKNLYSKSPFNTTFLSRLISCYQETDQFLVAENLLKSRINANATHSYLYVFLGYNYERQKQYEKAKINYEVALNSLDTNPGYGGIIGRIFKDYNSLDNAILAYKKSIQENPNANYSFQIAQIYGEKGAFKQMFESYINMIDNNENYLNTVQRFTSRYISDDAENENNILFKKTLLRKSASNPKDVWNLLLSWLFAQQKDYGKALIQEKGLYQRNATDLSSIFNLGKIAFNSSDFDAAKQCFDFVNEESVLEQEKINANLYIANIAVANKNPNTEVIFENVFKQFGKNASTIKIQVAYADFLTFQKNEPQKATTVLEEAFTFSSSKFDKARIKLKLGDVLVFTGRFNKALIYFSQIQSQLKNHELAQQARFKVAQTSYFKGDFTWAKAQLKVLKGSTTQLIANDAVSLFLKITDNEPVDSIPSGLIQLAKAELLAFQNKDEEALSVINNLISPKKPQNKKLFTAGIAPGEVIYDDVLFFHAKLLIKLEKYEDALVSFSKIVATDTQGIYTDDVYFEMAELYKDKLNNPEKASEYYQKIIFEHASSIYLVDARKKYRELRGDKV
jgi:tetratricopeptide (TPR) repeat protein